jgi:RNA polymerase sigma-70 factor, ECF subfamily
MVKTIKGEPDMSSLPVKANSGSMPDEELFQRLSAGDEAAFAIMMRRYNRRLYRAARSIVKDDVEAEDVLQDAYLLAYRRIDTFRGDAQLVTWLTRIVVNEAIARRRKTARRAEIIHLDGDLKPTHDRMGEVMDNAEFSGPEDEAIRAETRQLLERKIDRLPEAFRIVFMLRVVEEMTVEEVSAVLEIPEATVRSRHFRAKSMLRESISREIDITLEDAFSFDGERCNRIVAAVMNQLSASPAVDPTHVVQPEKGESP